MSDPSEDRAGWMALLGEFFFTPPLRDFWTIWRVLVVWNVIAFALVFVVCGVIAACVFRKHRVLSLALPLLAVLCGGAIGLFCGGILAFIVASLYRSASFAMSWYTGLVFSLALPVAYTGHSLSKFVFA